MVWISVYKHLVKFANGKGINLSFNDVNERFWNEFKFYIEFKAKHSRNTIYTVFSIIKAILNKALREKVITTNPFQFIKMKKPKSIPIFLTLQELRALKKTKCMNEQLKKSFFFSCYTGLRISDVKALIKENIKDDRIIITMKKTKKIVIVPFHKQVKEYLPDLNCLREEENI